MAQEIKQRNRSFIWVFIPESNHVPLPCKREATKGLYTLSQSTSIKDKILNIADRPKWTFVIDNLTADFQLKTGKLFVQVQINCINLLFLLVQC